MTSLKYSNKIKQLFKEAENQFSSAINTKIPGKEEQSDTLVSPAITPNATDQSQQEKAALTAKAMEKVKQSLEVSDELQSILNEIDKINKDVNANRWQLNDKDNTAYLPSKNAQIFKQNNYLCLSYNDKVELFQSVSELHDFLRKHNIPLPQNIKLHEAVLKEEDNAEDYIKPGPGAFTKLWKQYRDTEFPSNTLSALDMQKRAKKAFKPEVKKSKEDYVLQNKKGDLGVERFGNDMYITDVTSGPSYKMKKLIPNEKPKKECGATVGGSVGSAVQYTGDKLNEEDLHEVKPREKGWQGGMYFDNATKQFIDKDKYDQNNPNHIDWADSTWSRADGFAPLWFKWISTAWKGGIEFYPDKDPNFVANAHNFIRTKHNPTTRSERETTTWRKSLWDKYLDKNPWLDSSSSKKLGSIVNPRYGSLTLSNEELRAIAQDFKDKGYGDLLNGLDPNDPELVNKFHPVGVPRVGGWVGPNENPNSKLPKMVYNANIDPEVRKKWYDNERKKEKMSAEDKLLDYLAKRAGMTADEYYDKFIAQDILPADQDSFNGLRKHVTPKYTMTEPGKQNLDKPVTPAASATASKNAYADYLKTANDPANQWKYDEGTSFGKAFLNLRDQKKDIPLKEEDSPADFATGQSAIASDMAGAVDAASGVDTTATTDMNTSDYAADPETGAGAPFNNTPGFGDINIDAGGDYSPDMQDPNAMAPMPDMPEYKIVDVLVDENDPTKIKVRVKNKDTGKIETKDLSEIDA